jgi:hypothetical protein
LRGLDLADSSLAENSHDEIIVIGEIVRGEGGPVAVNSKFGWVLSGPSRDTGKNNNATLSHLVIDREEPAIYCPAASSEMI